MVRKSRMTTTPCFHCGAPIPIAAKDVQYLDGDLLSCGYGNDVVPSKACRKLQKADEAKRAREVAQYEEDQRYATGGGYSGDGE